MTGAAPPAAGPATDPLQAMLERSAALAGAYPPNSRYHGAERGIHDSPDGRRIPYLRRRLMPNPRWLALAGEHVVAEGDRLDLLAFRHLGDPELFWRLCDANLALRPAALLETPGAVLRLPLGGQP